jgi:competence ComEA-like helix-hairpin-helix protein
MPIIAGITFFLICLLHATAALPQPLVPLSHCSFVATEWADGDSFRIKTAAGEEHTVRLYGADCMEWHIGDDTDARRLRAQRRYFGITEVAPKAADAIAMAKDFGKDAAGITAALLVKPFTVYTRFRKAPGDGKHLRIYAFVKTADGADLAAELVKRGLARAHGIFDDDPEERRAADYGKMLVDLELQAAKRGLGIWSKTNWEKLPGEREAQRKDDDEANLAMGNHKLKPGDQINPNVATRDELIKLPGIGAEMANRIIEAREQAAFEKPEDLLRVPGIKPKTLDKFRSYLGFKVP